VWLLGAALCVWWVCPERTTRPWLLVAVCMCVCVCVCVCVCPVGCPSHSITPRSCVSVLLLACMRVPAWDVRRACSRAQVATQQKALQAESEDTSRLLVCVGRHINMRPWYAYATSLWCTRQTHTVCGVRRPSNAASRGRGSGAGPAAGCDRGCGAQMRYAIMYLAALFRTCTMFVSLAGRQAVNAVVCRAVG
jgi:hypothetical protein